MLNSEKELVDYIENNSYKFDAIVVEGYDGVGKGKVLDIISEILGVIPYRPDYNFWQKHDHRYKDRWKVSGFFWDVYSHFNTHSLPVMLFDRGIISGAVYAHDDSIALDYKNIIRDMKIIHILVECSDEDYEKFCMVRSSDKDIKFSSDNHKLYTSEYRRCFELAGIEYITYMNHFIDSDASRLESTCEGCGHYSHGICRHPRINKEVDKHSVRCSLSTDMEAQDVAEMLSM